MRNLTWDVVDIAECLQCFLQKINVNTADGSDLFKVLEIYRERCSTLVKLAQDIAFFYQDFTEYDSKLVKQSASVKKGLTSNALIVGILSVPIKGAVTLQRILSTWNEMKIVHFRIAHHTKTHVRQQYARPNHSLNRTHCGGPSSGL